MPVGVSEFPSQPVNEADPEVRKSRAAVIATEPIPETVEITRTRVKKNSRSVIIAAADLAVIGKPLLHSNMMGPLGVNTS